VASTSEPLREATAEVFDSWIDALVQRFSAAGLPDDVARELSIAMLGALEGAFVLSRAKRSTEPLEVAGRTMTEVVRNALARC
jgi:hypothetical protein